MASYMDLLGGDQERMRKALQGLVEEQEATIAQLKVSLAEYTDVLDRRILRTMVFRKAFGEGQTDTLTAETDTEEASKPVTEATRQLEKETHILNAYKEALAQVEAGGSLDSMGKIEISPAI